MGVFPEWGWMGVPPNHPNIKLDHVSIETHGPMTLEIPHLKKPPIDLGDGSIKTFLITILW